ncbi:uncharacterized protein TRAVEDRAFT_71266 [Trametes versicolor FP-101664 SS1]|uniref:uncharacterized protein n=1 Tax=Trametes versicolor (strain FP-101664) TaxID=717944 RepID=UPI0004623659|nr:uncharacterized protein TRAVEDRAFT_71266 [Trametes versicolor FP-101664 SS1]EIW59056.1 hypothetical protein TRAVEDRAFT_71266 [Trametes versicolor FP-101664 SS1]
MESLDNTFGAALIGLIVGAVLFGITILQTFTYFGNYNEDSRIVKSLVIILTVLDALHLVLCTRTIYWYLITNFTDADNLDKTTWSMALQTDCNGLIGLIVEVFFARRVWMMSHNWLITGVILVLAALHFGLGVVFTAQSFILGRFSKFKSLTWVTCLGLGAAAAADILIAGAMCYYLYRKRTGLKKTDSLVTTLMLYSINTGLATSIIGTISVISFGAMPTNFVWLGFFWIMGKCYVNSFLALLNSRDRLREKVTKAGVQLNHVGHGRSFQQSFSASNTPKDRKSPTLTGGVAVQIETITEYSSYHPRQQTGRRGASKQPMAPIKDNGSVSSSSPEV